MQHEQNNEAYSLRPSAYDIDDEELANLERYGVAHPTAEMMVKAATDSSGKYGDEECGGGGGRGGGGRGGGGSRGSGGGGGGADCGGGDSGGNGGGGGGHGGGGYGGGGGVGGGGRPVIPTLGIDPFEVARKEPGEEVGSLRGESSMHNDRETTLHGQGRNDPTTTTVKSTLPRSSHIVHPLKVHPSSTKPLAGENVVYQVCVCF